jgi:hypothetical protein
MNNNQLTREVIVFLSESFFVDMMIDSWWPMYRC